MLSGNRKIDCDHTKVVALPFYCYREWSQLITLYTKLKYPLPGTRYKKLPRLPSRRHNCTPKITHMKFHGLHHVLKSLGNSASSKLISKSLGDKPMKNGRRTKLEEFLCSKYAEEPELPGKQLIILLPN